MPEGEIDSLLLFFYFGDSAGLLPSSRLFELLSSYEQVFPIVCRELRHGKR
jgi:hypothetical protein